MKHIPNNVTFIAKSMRQNMTSAEEKAWDILRWKRMWEKFNRQRPLFLYQDSNSVDRFIIPDFYCSSLRLIIEIDWNIHNVPEVVYTDREKEMYLDGRWFTVLRFTNEDILQNEWMVMREIKQYIHQLSSPWSKGKYPKGDGDNFWFTLVELLVGVTISILIMMWVGVFITSGIGNLTYQQQQVEKKVAGTEFIESLQERFSLAPNDIEPVFYESWSPVSKKWVLMRVSQKFWEGGVMYIWTTEVNDYCGPYEWGIRNKWTDYESTTEGTQHVFVKTFYPFLEEGEDFTLDISDMLANQKKHQVTLGATDIWTWLPGSLFDSSPNKVFLNHPTDTSDQYISDTWNNRVLKYSTSGLEEILTSQDGLNEPMWLYYEDDTLYIANAGSGEILKYTKISAPEDFVNLQISENVNDAVSYFSLSFVWGSVDNLQIDIENIFFSWSQWNPNKDFAYIDWNSLHYYFVSNYSGSSDTIIPTPSPACSPSITTSYIFEENIPKQRVTTCDIYWSETVVTSESNLQDENFSNLDTIMVWNIWGIFESDKNYYVKLEMFDDSGDSLYENYYPFYSPGKNLEVVESGLNYPTSVSGTSFPADVQQLSTWTFSTEITYDPETDILLKTPIESFSLHYTSEKLSLDFDIYKNFDCYNKDATENWWKKEIRIKKQY